MSISRRTFIKLCTGTVAGFGVSRMFHPAVHEALAQTLTGERPPVFWLQGQGCTGCSVTLLNSVHPSIADVLLKIISLDFHPTLMGGEGVTAWNFMMHQAAARRGGYILAVEGAVPLHFDGRCCVVAEVDHREITMMEAVAELAAGAAAVLNIGTCAAFGGIPAAEGNETGAVGVPAFLTSRRIATPVINIPGCPPHPDWIVGTIGLALNALATDELELFARTALDENDCPKPFYRNVHMNCPRLNDFQLNRMATVMTDKNGCRFELGCKGPWSACDSFKRLWNNRVNWCVANATCIGCTSPAFPDGVSPFYVN